MKNLSLFFKDDLSVKSISFVDKKLNVKSIVLSLYTFQVCNIKKKSSYNSEKQFNTFKFWIMGHLNSTMCFQKLHQKQMLIFQTKNILIYELSFLK